MGATLSAQYGSSQGEGKNPGKYGFAIGVNAVVCLVPAAKPACVRPFLAGVIETLGFVALKRSGRMIYNDFAVWCRNCQARYVPGFCANYPDIGNKYGRGGVWRVQQTALDPLHGYRRIGKSIIENLA